MRPLLPLFILLVACQDPPPLARPADFTITRPAVPAEERCAKACAPFHLASFEADPWGTMRCTCATCGGDGGAP